MTFLYYLLSLNLPPIQFSSSFRCTISWGGGSRHVPTFMGLKITSRQILSALINHSLPSCEGRIYIIFIALTSQESNLVFVMIQFQREISST